MKKIVLPVLLLVLVMFAACNKESYYHTMSVVRPVQVGVVFADQDMDTMIFYTTDNFWITTNQTWATIPDTISSGKITNVYRSIWTVVAPIVFEPNTTGEIRTAQAQIRVAGDDDWNNTATITFRQLSWISINRPTAKYSYVDRVITGAEFEAKDSAAQFTDTLEFYAFGDWTLTDGKLFAHPEVTSGEAGQQKVPVTVVPNDGLAERHDTILLTSRTVTTPIAFIQEGKKEEKAE